MKLCQKITRVYFLYMVYVGSHCALYLRILKHVIYVRLLIPLLSIDRSECCFFCCVSIVILYTFWRKLLLRSSAAVARWLRRWTCTQQNRFNSRWYPYEPRVVAGKAFSQNCSCVPVKVLPTLVGTSEPLNKGVSDVKFVCKLLPVPILFHCIVMRCLWCSRLTMVDSAGCVSVVWCGLAVWGRTSSILNFFSRTIDFTLEAISVGLYDWCADSGESVDDKEWFTWRDSAWRHKLGVSIYKDFVWSTLWGLQLSGQLLSMCCLIVICV